MKTISLRELGLENKDLVSIRNFGNLNMTPEEIAFNIKNGALGFENDESEISRLFNFGRNSRWSRSISSSSDFIALELDGIYNVSNMSALINIIIVDETNKHCNNINILCSWNDELKEWDTGVAQDLLGEIAFDIHFAKDNISKLYVLLKDPSRDWGETKIIVDIPICSVKFSNLSIDSVNNLDGLIIDIDKKVVTKRNNDILGEADNAIKLKTERSINGTMFDGSKDIVTSKWGASRNIKIGNVTKAINGQENIEYTLSELGAAPLNSPKLTGTPEAPNPAAGDNSSRLATTKFVVDSITGESNARSQAITSVVNSFNLALKNTNDDIANIADALSNETTSREQLARTVQDLASLENNSSAIDDQLSSLDTRIKNLTESVTLDNETRTQSSQELDLVLQGIEESIYEIDTRASNALAKTEELKDSMQALGEKTITIESNMQTVEDSMQTLNTKVGNIDTILDMINGEVI